MAKSPEEYFSKHPEYSHTLNKLRSILLSTELEEAMKWGIPTYCLENKNVAGIGAFKGYAGIWFFNGAFLADQANVLINAQEGKTKGMRQWRFSSIEEVNENLVRAYILRPSKTKKITKRSYPRRNR